MGSSSSPPPPPAMRAATSATLSDVHSDILETHVLTRLNGPTLASLSCTCSQLYKLSSQDSLWTNICHSTWPSTTTPILRRTIADFDGGARCFFSECYPSPTMMETPRRESSGSCDVVSEEFNPDRLMKLMSAVDLYYRGEVVISRVVETETVSGWFRCSPFRVDLLDPKDVVPTPIRYPSGMGYEDTYKNLEENLRLSWILIDPIGRRAMNVSSGKPVSVRRHWLNGEVHARFAVMLEHVLCEVVVACGGCEEGLMMQVREVSLQVENLDGVHLTGRDSLVILGRGLEGERGNGNREEEGKRVYEEFLERKKEIRERKLRREGRLDSLCVIFGVLVVGLFWLLILFR